MNAPTIAFSVEKKHVNTVKWLLVTCCLSMSSDYKLKDLGDRQTHTQVGDPPPPCLRVIYLFGHSVHPEA